MDDIQGELFERPPISVVKNTTGVRVIITTGPDWNRAIRLVCPLCNNTGYAKGTKCTCSED